MYMFEEFWFNFFRHHEVIIITIENNANNT